MSFDMARIGILLFTSWLRGPPPGAFMAIYRMFREGVFSPDEIESLSAAYEAALKVLRLKDREDPVTELIAAKIIQVYRLGEHDPATICTRSLKELGVRPAG